MTCLDGVWVPEGVNGRPWAHSLRHVRSIEWSLGQCQRRRRAVQAGGNLGLWPRRMAEVFAHVVTFEPDALSRACLSRNVPANVSVVGAALGDRTGRCAIEHRGIGSHRVRVGDEVPMVTIDGFEWTDVDLLQLDIEGYEWHALTGATETIRRCQPLIQLELRNHTALYGQSDDAVRALLGSFGYREVSQQQGSDVVFAGAKWRPAA